MRHTAVDVIHPGSMPGIEFPPVAPVRRAELGSVANGWLGTIFLLRVLVYGLFGNIAEEAVSCTSRSNLATRPHLPGFLSGFQ
jgi:hypothetical protein